MLLDRRIQGRVLARAGLPAAQGSIEMVPAHPGRNVHRSSKPPAMWTAIADWNI